MKLLFAILTAAVLAISASFPVVAAEPGELVAAPASAAAPGAHKAKKVKKAKKVMKAKKMTKHKARKARRLGRVK